MTEIEKGRAGPLFEEFLKDEGVLEDTTARAIKRVLAFQLATEMERQSLTRVDLARRLGTSRSQINRLLDPGNESVTLATLARAAKAVGRQLRIELQ